MFASSGCISLLIAICSLLLSSNASEPTVKQIQAGLATFGLVAISVVLLTRALSLQSTSLIADVTLRILRGLVVYGLVLWVIGIFDDNLYRWVLANPFDAGIVAITGVLLDLEGPSFLEAA